MEGMEIELYPCPPETTHDIASHSTGEYVCFNIFMVFFVNIHFS